MIILALSQLQNAYFLCVLFFTLNLLNIIASCVVNSSPLLIYFKFGYKQKSQRFPVRRFPGDRHQVDSDLVALTPDEPPPPPKPAKNFIKKNREKVTAKKDTTGTVTLTQDQLNAILQSVGKVASGDEEAVKISIGNVLSGLCRTE